MNQTVVAVFNTHAEAEAAKDQLVTQGFSRSDIDIKASPTTGTTAGTTTTTAAHEDEGFFGSIGHFFGNMFGGDDDKEYAGHYTEAVRRGGAVLTLQADETRLTAAHDALQLAGAVDIDEQVSTWKQTGYAGETAGVAASSTALTGDKTVVPVIAEELEVGKRKVEGGVVRVTSLVTSRPVHESVDLTRESASIERRPVTRDATQADLAGFQDRTIEVKESAEKAVVSKSAHVVEEVVVGKQVTHETQNIDDTVRRTEVDVDRGGVGQAGMTGATSSMKFDDHAAGFRTHHGANYASGGSYDDYEPAYRSGFSMRNDSRFAGQEWDAVEPQARSSWEGKNPGTWEKMKGAVQQGWKRTVS